MQSTPSLHHDGPATTLFVWLSLILLLLFQEECEALKSFVERIPNGDKVRNPSSEDQIWQGVGHIRPEVGGPRNQFGIDFSNAGYQWTTELCQKDSDCDGRSNGEELGDPKCIWKQGDTPEFQHGITHPGVVDAPPNGTEIESSFSKQATSGGKFRKDGICGNFDVSKLPESSRNHTFTMTNYAVPSQETTYGHQQIVFQPEEEMYAVWMQPIFDNPDVVHQITLFHCDKDPKLKDATCKTPTYR